MSISRAFIVLGLATFLSAGTAFAQAPPPAPPAQGTTSSHKCGQTTKGCHKNQSKPATKPQNKCGQTPKGCKKNQTKPPAGAPPAGAPPQ